MLFKKLARLLTTGLFAGTIVASAVSPALAGLTPQFNNHPTNEAEFLQGRNVTQNGPAFTDPVSANAGDEVDVSVYYHNSIKDSVAKNVRIKVTLPTNIGAKHVITGQLSADNAATATGSTVNGQEVGLKDLTINSNSDTSLAFVPGSVRWYPNRMTTVGAGANLPGGQTGDSIITSGITIGDLNGCFEYAGFVFFRVKLSGITIPKANIQLSKEVRINQDGAVYASEVTTKPGTQMQYRLTVKNTGAGTAKNVTLKDTLPEGISYVGPTTLTKNGQTSSLPDGLTTTGIKIVDELKSGEQVYVTFIAASSTTLKNNDCRINSVHVTAENADLPADATAKSCFTVDSKAILQLSKNVRRVVNGSNDAFISKVTANPGNTVEYQITVRNLDGTGVAKNVRLFDSLPNDVTYVGPTYVTRNGQTTQIADGITTAAGVQILADLQPQEVVYVTFKATTSTALKNNDCRVNTVRVNAENATIPGDATAEVCTITSTPTPTPPAKPIELPKTGPEAAVAGLLGLGAAAGTAGRYAILKRQLKKQARKVTVL